MKPSFFADVRVPQSGIYRVYHDRHRLMHEATLLGGSHFPRCKKCGKDVYFELVRPLKDTQVIGTSTHVVLEWPDTSTVPLAG